MAESHRLDLASPRPLPPQPTAVPEVAAEDNRNNSLDTLGSDSGETSVDGMGVFGSINAISGARMRRQSDYFGPSSTMSLLGKARNVLGRRCGGHGPLGSETCPACRDQAVSVESSISQASPVRVPEPRSGNVMFGWSVPPRAEADSLLESYWAFFHSLYPFLHRPSFIHRYLAIWSPQTTDTHSHTQDADSLPQPLAAVNYYDGLGDHSFHRLLNVVFALGALSNPDMDERDRDGISGLFFTRAKKLLDLDLLAQGSIPLVQTLLLMGQYLQSTDMSSSCWNIVGMAIRVAQCIGLHHEPSGSDQGSDPRRKYGQVDTEMRRRTWAGCVLLDR